MLYFISAPANLNITCKINFQPSDILDVTFPSVQTIKATSQLGDPRVTYNLEDGMVPETNMPVRFYLSPNREDGSASILVSEPLDYETTPFFYLRVRAQNVAAVPLAAFTTVYINVTGVIPAPLTQTAFLLRYIIVMGIVRHCWYVL